MGPRQQPTSSPIKVPVGITQSALAYGVDVAKWIGNDNELVTFKAIEVFEEVPRYRTQKVETPAEEYIRPGWYGPIWKPENIGQVYNQFFSTGAITDPITINDPGGSSLGGQDIGTDANNADPQANDPFWGSDDPNNPAVVKLDPQVSIAQAVEFLVLTYSYIKQAEGVNIDEFVQAYTWRPIATIVDMFGTHDLTLSADGSKVLAGYEGFHSRAFGQYADLFGLVTSDIENILGIKRSDTSAQKADTRKRKQDAVLDYLSALQLSRAIIG
jgi:hypothetical protein